MKNFEGKVAVITGGGTGMGRALAIQLAAEGCSVAICDVSEPNMTETARLAEATVSSGARVTTHVCDVADEAAVLVFRDEVREAHGPTLELLFNNAGISGGGSFVTGDRAEWDRVFGVCWSGVYFSTRAFLPLLVASDEAVIVNTSSVNGFWATLGENVAHTAYATAKFAVKGFSEALLTDLRVHAPHVKVALVMPGHVGTAIVENSRAVLGHGDFGEMSADEVGEARTLLAAFGREADGWTDDQVRDAVARFATEFETQAPLSAAGAATIILTGVREGRWRILVGEDAQALDQLVRADPENVYEPEFLKSLTVLRGG